MDKYTAAWLHPNVYNFYTTHRHSVDEIYKSERRFLSSALKKGMSVLDVGCAAGGFSNIMRTFEPSIRYFGIDISQGLLNAGNKRYKTAVFIRADATAQPFKDNIFDLVYSSGLCHVMRQYQGLIREAYRVSRRYILFDVRLTEGHTLDDPERSFLKIEFDGAYDGTRTPYIVLNLKEFILFLKTLAPAPECIRAYGYIHPVSNMADSIFKEVCMAFFLLEKGRGNDREPVMDIDLPISV